MQVTNEQLDKAAQAVWRATSDGLGLTWAWTDQAAVSRDFYRKLALAVLATLPDAPEPIEGERRAAADAAERWHRAQKAKEGERWRIAEGAPHRALGPGGKSVWFYMEPERGADCDHEACAAFVARENARLDAEEAKCK